MGPIAIVMQHENMTEIEDSLGQDTKKEGEEAVKRITDKLDEKFGSKKPNALVYVAFGTQPNGITRKGVINLVKALIAASDRTVVYLVRPKLLPNNWSGNDFFTPLTHTTATDPDMTLETITSTSINTPDDDVFFKSLEDQEFARNRLLVHKSDFAPQVPIFLAFRKGGEQNRHGDLRFTFLTHGGAASLSEAAGLGIPMLCLPLLQRDQAGNCEAVARHGLGRDLGKLSLLMISRSLIAFKSGDDSLIAYDLVAGKKALKPAVLAAAHLAEISSPGQKEKTDAHDHHGFDRRDELTHMPDSAGRDFLQDFYANKFLQVFTDSDGDAGELLKMALHPHQNNEKLDDEASNNWLEAAKTLKNSFDDKFCDSDCQDGVKVLTTEASLLLRDTKIRTRVMEKLEENQKKIKANTLSRATDVGPLLARYADMDIAKVLKTDPWYSLYSDTEENMDAVGGAARKNKTDAVNATNATNDTATKNANASDANASAAGAEGSNATGTGGSHTDETLCTSVMKSPLWLSVIIGGSVLLLAGIAVLVCCCRCGQRGEDNDKSGGSFGGRSWG
eukprot:g11077.t1